MMIETRGRLEGCDARSGSQVASKSSHSLFENPDRGLSGRTPRRTLYVTADAGMQLKGGDPVMTCQGNR